MTSLIKVPIEDIPYFSRSEWFEVYNSIFGKKYEDWVEAYKHLCVWKVRVPKLPVGIECTIPLLHAQIALADHSLDTSMKTPILHLAILRFVTIVTKGYEQRYLMGKKMHNLAEKMKLPHYLIDLRNQIIHSDNIFGNTDTYSIALNVCFQWLKTNYWKVEEKKHYRRKSMLPKKIKKFQKRSLEKLSENKTSCSKLRIFIEKRLLSFTTYCGKSDDSFMEKKLEKALNLELIAYSAKEKEDAMNIIVADLFLSPKMVSWLKEGKGSDEGKNCKCKSHSVGRAVKYFGSHILVILEIGGFNNFVKSLIGNGTGSPLVRKAWVNYLINMSIDGTQARKVFLEANGMNVWKYKHVFKWKPHLFTLFSLGKNWTITLANFILENNLVKVDPENMNRIKSLVNLYKRGSVKVKAPSNGGSLSKSKILKSCKNVYTLESLISKSQKVSKSTSKYVNEICSHAKENKEDKIEGGKVYLGVLPHQVGDPYLYKKLILPEIKQSNNEI